MIYNFALRINSTKNHFYHNYNYNIQGREKQQDKISVIGDKDARWCAEFLLHNYDVIPKLSKNISRDIKFINVIRNSFDNVAAIYQRDKKEISVEIAIKDFFDQVENAEKIKNMFPENTNHTIYLEELIENPRESIKGMTDFLGLDTNDEHVENCTKVIMKEPNKRRYSVSWSDSQLKTILDTI